MLIPSECLALFSAIVERRPILLPAAERMAEFNRLVTAFVIADRIETFHLGPPVQPGNLHIHQTPWVLPLLAPEADFKVKLTDRGDLVFSRKPIGADWGAYSHFRGIDFLSAAPHVFFSGAIPPRLHSPAMETLLADVPAVVRPLVNLYAATRLSVLDVPLRVEFAVPALRGMQASVNFAPPASPETASILADHPVLAGKNDDLIQVLGYRRPATAECLRLLEDQFGAVVKELYAAGNFELTVPPVAGVLLSRLPDRCNDVGTVMRELLELRDQWEGYRRTFARVEAVLRSQDSSLADVRNARATVNADAVRFGREFGTGAAHSVRARVAFDGVLAVVRLASVERFAMSVVLAALQPIIPRIGDYAASSRTSIAFKTAKEVIAMPGYRALATRKLGIDE